MIASCAMTCASPDRPERPGPWAPRSRRSRRAARRRDLVYACFIDFPAVAAIHISGLLALKTAAGLRGRCIATPSIGRDRTDRQGRRSPGARWRGESRNEQSERSFRHDVDRTHRLSGRTRRPIRTRPAKKPIRTWSRPPSPNLRRRRSRAVKNGDAKLAHVAGRELALRPRRRRASPVALRADSTSSASISCRSGCSCWA